MADREKVINGLKTCIGMTAMGGCEGCPYNDLAEENCQGALMADALELLKKEPVNCSDCKHYGYNNMTNQDGFCYCIKHHEYPSPDFFCADGERR